MPFNLPKGGPGPREGRAPRLKELRARPLGKFNLIGHLPKEGGLAKRVPEAAVGERACHWGVIEPQAESQRRKNQTRSIEPGPGLGGKRDEKRTELPRAN
jgi:hypothetical protein